MGKLDNEHIEGKLLLLAGNILTTALLTVGSVLSRLSVDFPPSHPHFDLGAVLAFCIAASAASAALLTWKHGLWADLALLAAGGMLLWRLREKLLEGWVLGRPPWLSDFIDEYPAVLFLLCAMLALAMGLIVVRTRQWYLAAALSVGLVLSPIIGGTLPMWGAMLCSFSAWGAMLLTALFSRKDPESLGRAQLLSLAGMWVMILLLVMALPMEGYTRPQWATDARNSLIRGVTARLERFMDTKALETGVFAELGLDLSIPGEGGSAAVSGPAGEEGGPSGSIGTGFRQREDLLAAGPRRYASRRMMRVSSDQPGGGRIYLRGGSLGVYTGDAWEMLGTATEADPSRYPVRTTAGGGSYTISIQDNYFGGTYYYPYHLTDGWGAADESGRLAMPSAEEQTAGPQFFGERYTVGYAPGTPEDGFTPLAGPLAEEELRYRQEVVPEYLEVPHSTQNALGSCLWQLLVESLETELADAGEERRAVLEGQLRQLRQPANAFITPEDFGSLAEPADDLSPPERYRAVMAAASRTAALLKTLAAYDLNTPAMEEGEDFAGRFLKEGRGYCVHFATAGALLLRMQGVPARYVTGYVVRLDGVGRGEVMDSDAHAWVEVYVDGCGWYPVEMTPGYSGGGGDVTLSGTPETPAPEESGQPDEPEPDRPEEEDPASDGPDQPEDLPEEELPGGEAPEEASFVFPWRAVLRTVLVLGALAGGYALSFLPRRLERKDPDANRSAISAYRRYRRAADLGGAEDEILEELGRKAKFSQHTLTEEERETAWVRLEAARDQLLARRTGWRKLPLWLLRPLL